IQLPVIDTPRIPSHHVLASTQPYPLSLHDALPIYYVAMLAPASIFVAVAVSTLRDLLNHGGSEKTADFAVVALAVAFLSKAAIKDRKSTRLNSSHVKISYAVFCLKKT